MPADASSIGPAVALPVMQGKAALFKQFGGVAGWPVVLATQDTDRANDRLLVPPEHGS